MTAIALKLISAGAVIVPAVAYLGFAGMKDGMVQYHIQVDAFVKDARYQNQRVRLAGKVSDQQLSIGSGRLGAKFVLQGQSAHVPVSYAGIVPDLFKAGCDVIAEGKMDRDGTFKADVVMTKCASKYESNGHGATEKKS